LYEINICLNIHLELFKQVILYVYVNIHLQNLKRQNEGMSACLLGNSFGLAIPNGRFKDVISSRKRESLFASLTDLEFAHLLSRSTSRTRECKPGRTRVRPCFWYVVLRRMLHVYVRVTCVPRDAIGCQRLQQIPACSCFADATG